MSPAPAPADTSVKAEPLEPQERQSDGGTSSPPPSITVKTEVKKEVKKEEPKDGKEHDEEENDTDKPCTKMTMRLRRNLNNPQCVSRPKDELLRST